MRYRKAYLLLGFLIMVLGGFHITVSLLAGNAFPETGFTFMTLVVVCLCQSYLAPQFQSHDERTKFIRHRAMFYTFFAIIIYLFGLMILLNTSVLVPTALQTVNLPLTLVFVTVFLGMVILPKVY